MRERQATNGRNGGAVREILDVRAQWCRPEEPILWCLSREARGFRFEVDGLKANGTPVPGLGVRIAKGVGLGLLAVVAVATLSGGSESGDTGSAKPSPPKGFVTGSSPDCIAVAEMARIAEAGAEGFWLLTPARLARLVVGKPGAERKVPDVGALLGGAKRVFGFGRDDAKPEAPEESEPSGPVVREKWSVPWEAIVGIDVHQRKLGRKYSPSAAWYLRFTFRDGSTFEIGGDHEADAVAQLAAMTRGER
ncbi:hypothetical protein [Saccharopolyspora pogona]|uniref:hypothetical protein n=1 Tax=Saccharopolyspora pogona TaxID=333966 RepID=UPI0016843C85|nr:hypothetical protein [Saccharopolyspora pogona]